MVGNEEEKSWINLFSKYCGGTHEDRSSTGINIDSHLLSCVLYFLRSGHYNHIAGWPDGKSSFGDYWNIIGSFAVAQVYGFSSTWLSQSTGHKGDGFSLRCVARSPNRAPRKVPIFLLYGAFFNMGNYYNFYAATVGSGTSTFIGEAPDSICPKGWRMVGNEGEKSFVKLFAEYYGGTKTGSSLTGGDTHLLSNIFSILRSGAYYWNSGGLGNRAGVGYYWLLKAYSYPRAYALGFYSTWLDYQFGYYEGGGFSLRCVAKLKTQKTKSPSI